MPIKTGGRGLRSGQEARINQDESDVLRRVIEQLSVGLVPIGCIVPAVLTAADKARFFDSTGKGKTGFKFQSWALCNGSNGTPALNGTFVRWSTSSSGTTGGSDSVSHTHAIDHDHGAFTSAAESGHTHAIDHDHASFTSAAESGHTHAVDHDHASFTSGSHTLTTAEIPSHSHSGLTVGGITVIMDGGAGATARSITYTGTNSTGNALVTATSGGGGGHDHSVDVPAFTGTSGASSGHTHSIDVPSITATSGASSGHTHSIDVPAFTGTSGDASVTENRPAYYELVPVMRLE